MKPPAISEIGEFSLIERIKKIVPPANAEDIIVGIGDDTAVIKVSSQKWLLATCDIQIEDTHFRMKHTTSYQLGRRAMAINLSDIASMGGKPLYALISMGLLPNVELEKFEDLFRGMSDELTKYSSFVIGGNLAHTEDKLVIDIFLLGETSPDKILLRNGARPSDRIFVTGKIGASAAGFYVLEKFGLDYPKKYQPLALAHLQPTAKIEIGMKIAQSGFATSMIDISDGLASDLKHICDSSGVGAEIHEKEIPFPDLADDVAKTISKSKLDLALHGGEDYELLFTMKPETPSEVIERIATETKTEITEVGKILSKEEGYNIKTAENQRLPLQPKGWDHFGREK